MRRAPALLTIVWLLVGLGLYVSQTLLFQALGIYVAIPFLIHWLWGAVQAIVFIVLIFFRQDVRILAPMMVASGAMFFFGVDLFRRVGDQVAFYFVRGSFDHAVAAAAISQGRPVLIAFAWTDRLDFGDPEDGPSESAPATGRAIVYDETDAIDLVGPDTWQEKSPRLAELLKGRPERCMRFADPHYYLCSFS